MSYDLFMKKRSGKYTLDEFNGYFLGRPFYEIQGEQAWYQNEDTGVYFMFEYQGGDDYPIAFNMNYFRPSYFVNEAEPEVAAFIENNDIIVDDPQMGGMGQGEFDKSKFISGWKQGNEFGFKAILQHQEQQLDILTLPSEQLEKIWSWNFNQIRVQESVGEDMFIPRIMLLQNNEDVITVCVWPDGIPIAIPPVDYVLIGRTALGADEETALCSWNDVQPILEAHSVKMLGDAYYLYYDIVPEDIEQFIFGLDAFDPSHLAGLPVDQVLDRELVEKNR